MMILLAFHEYFSSRLDPAHLNLDPFDLIPNPDKFDKCDPDCFFLLVIIWLFFISNMNSSFQWAGSGALSAISETRWNNPSLSNYIEVLNYRFFHSEAPTAAVAAGIYISEDIKSVLKSEVQLDMPLVESCWVEIDPCNGKGHIIIVGLYIM